MAHCVFTTLFVASPGTDRVSRSNSGAWLILCPASDGSWEPWGRLQCWCERGGASASDNLGYHFDLLLLGVDHVVPLAESSIGASKGGKFAINLTSMQPLSRGVAHEAAGTSASGRWRATATAVL
ncbi:hypothetical protein E2562_015095 [Oryza meyeriana var. granulata]|uniref:Uncharacterized protein n=1 Tax=Oryza meyeriana var. granulata TaxID=110450 RepID=A0A6G1DWZ2_9ORYZ|nr:hypothetical protein E2562_015095 [Oryza meyeriana var. granulata]